MVTGLLISVLLGSVGCTKAIEPQPSPTEDLFLTELPNLTYPNHLGEVFRITWFKQPNSTDYDRLVLYTDGYVEHWSVDILWSANRVGSGQLSQEQQEEIQTILKKVAETRPLERIDPVAARENLAAVGVETFSAEPIKGLKIITLSFPWRAENYALSFSESNCTDELGRLLEIAGTTLGETPVGLDAPQDLCQASDTYREQQEPTLATATSIPFANLPSPVRVTHTAAPLFRVTWFGKPFDGPYSRLTLYGGGYVVYEQFTGGGVYRKVRGTLSESERQQIRIALNLATSEHPIEQPAGTIVILLTAGDSHCSSHYHRLFEIANAALERESPGFEGFQNPCPQQ